MRRAAVGALIVFLGACGDAAQEPVTTTVPTTAGSTTSVPTTTVAPDSSTTMPDVSTTTTTAPEPTSTLPPLQGLRYEAIAELPFPTNLVFVPALGDVVVTTKDGRVWELDGGEPEVVLDISNRVRNSGEQGLLGIAFHPDDPRRMFLHYSADDGDTVLSEFPGGLDGVDEERVLLRRDQPASNHNGGQLAFGPDGMLYLGLGDGGGADDRFGHGQRPDTILGTILRIDVDGGDPYGIPPDNPFVDGGGEPEVWAYGLRNPWRFSFDAGALYIGDVGQNAWEEIDVVPVEPVGYNFGWPITEGLHCFSPPSGCEVEGLTLPVLEISHQDGGTCSVTGGVVYRGSSIPELDGHYLYSDFCGGYLRSFVWDGAAISEQQDWTGSAGAAGQVVSFGIDVDGEVYLLTTERVLRIVPVR